MAQKHITTSIAIKASPEKIWEVLTDFSDYKNWNPFIKSIEGEVREGHKIKVDAGGMVFKPIVTVFAPNKELRWKGRLLFRGLFDGEHSFKIVDHQDGTSRFVHEEIFSGILVGLFLNKLETEIKPEFEKMNNRLKELVERTHYVT